MLARVFRLRRSVDLAKVYKFGKSSSTHGFYIKMRSTNFPTSRVAVVVPKKVSKKAVVRNRIKRRIYEIMRTNWPQIQPGFDMIIMVTVDISKTTPTQLETNILQCLKRLGVRS